MRIYIADLAAYNEGLLAGEWVALPCGDIMAEVAAVLERTTEQRVKALGYEDLEAMEEAGLYRSEEWAIHDYEGLEWYGKVSEWEDLEALNDACEAYDNLDEAQREGVGLLIEDGIADDIEDAISKLDDLICTGETSMHDVAYEYVESCGMLDEGSFISRYIDYDSMGRDMELEGTYLEDSNGVIWEYIN